MIEGKKDLAVGEADEPELETVGQFERRREEGTERRRIARGAGTEFGPEGAERGVRECGEHEIEPTEAVKTGEDVGEDRSVFRQQGRQRPGLAERAKVNEAEVIPTVPGAVANKVASESGHVLGLVGEPDEIARLLAILDRTEDRPGEPRPPAQRKGAVGRVGGEVHTDPGLDISNDVDRGIVVEGRAECLCPDLRKPLADQAIEALDSTRRSAPCAGDLVTGVQMSDPSVHRGRSLLGRGAGPGVGLREDYQA